VINERMTLGWDIRKRSSEREIEIDDKKKMK